MRSVSKRVQRMGVILVLFTILSAQAASAAPRRDDASDRRGSFVRVVQRIVKALEDCRLGFPPG